MSENDFEALKEKVAKENIDKEAKRLGEPNAKINPAFVNETENSRRALLAEADRTVSIDRAATHGSAEDSFQTMADYWTTFLQKENVIEKGIKLTPRHIAMMMTLFKIARTHNNPKYRDNYVDILGYAACAGEIALKPQFIA